jgi:hypothetical protein
MSSNLTFGCDPEIFAAYTFNNEDYVYPPIAFKRTLEVSPIIDDKKHPIYIKRDNYNWMQDGVAFELTLKKPYKDVDKMFSAIAESIEDITKFLHEYKFRFFARPVVKFDPNLFYKNMDEEFKQCVIFGCDPDEDAILPDYNCQTFNVEKHPYRYGGGHFHIGSEDKDEREIIWDNYNPFVKLLAITIGNTCIGNSEFLEEEKLRVFHYGKPGRFRKQPHGIEYRTPSNSWIQNKNTLEKMIDRTKVAFYWLNHPEEALKVIDNYLLLTIDAITNSDQNLSLYILEELKV